MKCSHYTHAQLRIIDRQKQRDRDRHTDRPAYPKRIILVVSFHDFCGEQRDDNA